MQTPVHAAADKHLKPMLKVIHRAIARGRYALGHAGKPNVDGAANTIKLELLHGLRAPLLATLIDGGKAALGMLKQRRAAEGRTLADPTFTMRFDAESPDAIAWAEEHAGLLATQISDTTRQRIRDAIVAALEGDGIDAAYSDIEDAVGDEARAELIARTEIMTAANEGQREAWDQAIEAGLLTGNEKKEWIATGDANVCPQCDELDGTVVGLDEEYPNDGGDGPPAHPDCRCTEGIVG
jgi:SPP1 gp7 family putative phage head morphogenesis protein